MPKRKSRIFCNADATLLQAIRSCSGTVYPGRRLLGFSCVVLLAVSAAEPAGASDVQVTVDRAACANAVEHRPPPDVEYQPGVDVYGRPVARADLRPGPQLVLPETLIIDLSADLAEQLGLLPFLHDPDAQLRIGEVAVQDGRVFLDERPLFDADAAFLEALCQAAVQ